MGDLFDTTGFPERWNCGIWSETLGYTHIIADLLTFGAYTAIPIILIYFILQRKDAPFPSIFWLFGTFILACGTVHLIEAIIFYHPIYRFSAMIKVITAVASWGTVFALIHYMPKVMNLPTLEIVNSRLEAEVKERTAAEERLQQKVDQLEKFGEFSTDREHRMVELKRQVNALSDKLGEPLPYDLSFTNDDGTTN